MTTQLSVPSHHSLRKTNKSKFGPSLGLDGNYSMDYTKTIGGAQHGARPKRTEVVFSLLPKFLGQVKTILESSGSPQLVKVLPVTPTE
ncbi:hypothetical protein J6590_055838 [Homalodisca vitripennis]|nr:hypothetical protein J6590_055838 [Homalodisca vitripennis]